MTDLPSSSQPAQYYEFSRYITSHRMLTYWRQLDEVLAFRPSSVLEVGPGTGLVSSYLKHIGIDVTTVDLNPALLPDVIADVTDLDSVLSGSKFDVVLCARVLHHVDRGLFSKAIAQIAGRASIGAVITLPREDFSCSIGIRRTAGSMRYLRVPLPMVIKRRFAWGASRFGLWKIDDSPGNRLGEIVVNLSNAFETTRTYRISEDPAHQMFVLTVPQASS